MSLVGVLLTCPRCGDVEIDTEECIVIPEGRNGRLRAICPLCDMLLDRIILDESMRLLVTTPATIIVPDDISEMDGGGA